VKSVRIEKLVIYPIKSCGALDVPEFVLGEEGPFVHLGQHQVGDREWMIAGPTGEMFTQRQVSRMSLLTLKIENEKLWIKVSEKYFEVPFASPLDRRMTVRVHGTPIEASICETEALNKALSEFLAEPCLLVHFDQKSEREATKKGEGLGVQTRFTDTSPYLVLSQESLDDLNSKMEKKIGLERFRGNIIVSGGEVFGEDHWPILKSGKVTLENSKACGRCVVTTIDPLLGKVDGKDPLKTLAKFRRDGSNVFFGQYFITKSFGAVLRVGDVLEF